METFSKERLVLFLARFLLLWRGSRPLSTKSLTIINRSTERYLIVQSRVKKFLSIGCLISLALLCLAVCCQSTGEDLAKQKAALYCNNIKMRTNKGFSQCIECCGSAGFNDYDIDRQLFWAKLRTFMWS